MKKVSGTQSGRDTMVIVHSNGIFQHCIQWCTCQESAPLTFSFSDIVYFHPVCSPQDGFHI